MPVVGASLGLLFFLVVFGVHILCPEQVGWLLQHNNQDAAQHLLGWEFFRNEPWHLPLGIITDYGYPIQTSIVYTDSIPLFALLAKCFNPYLPQPGQYFGIWLALCYVLQGWFAWRISQVITQNPWVSLFITLFFLLSPILLNRTLEHQALVAQWLLLAGIYLNLRAWKPSRLWAWLLLTCIACMIHAYLAFMVLCLEVAFLLTHCKGSKFKIILGSVDKSTLTSRRPAACPRDPGVLLNAQVNGTDIDRTGSRGLSAGRRRRGIFDRNLNCQQTLLFLLFQSSCLIFIAWLCGYFVINMPSNLGLGGYQSNGMNLLAPLFPTGGALLLPNHWSSFLPTISTRFVEQGDEGFNYFGLGVIGLIVFSFVSRRTTDAGTMAEPNKSIRMLGCICLLLTVFALSNDIVLGNQIIAHYSPTLFMQKFDNIWRASGRFFWPMYYLIIVITLMNLGRRFKPPMLVLILSIGVAVQCLDLYPKLQQIHQFFSLPALTPANILDARLQNNDGRYQHVVFLPFIKNPQLHIPNFQYYMHDAALHHMTVNMGYFARQDNTAMYAANRVIIKQVLQGNLDPKTLYVITQPMLARLIKARVPQQKHDQIILCVSR